MKKNEILIKLVKQEAKKLKEIAKPIELKKLDFENLESDNRNKCVYGQMTGDCFNKRAEKLIMTVCERVYTSGNFNGISDSKLNGKPLPNRLVEDGCERRINYYSSIEVFIYNEKNQKNGNNKRLINYLNGTTKTLRLV